MKQSGGREQFPVGPHALITRRRGAALWGGQAALLLWGPV